MKRLIFVFLFSLAPVVAEKVRLITVQYNRPDFVELQYRSLQKFFKHDFELIVMSDAPTLEMSNQIRSECERFGLDFVQYPQNLHNDTQLIRNIKNWGKIRGITGYSCLGEMLGTHPSVRHCNVVQFAMERFVHNYDGVVGVLDGDVFFMRDFSLDNYLNDCDFVATHRTDETATCEFMWIGLAFFDTRRLPNIQDLSFNLGLMAGKHVGDSGSETYNYLQANPSVRTKMYHKYIVGYLRTLPTDRLRSMGFTNGMLKVLQYAHDSAEFHMDHHVIHFSRSSFTKDGSYDAKNRRFMRAVKKVL